jgi:MGT family glycosyltransferase
MRVLITCWPFTGHVHGQLSVASALAARGHEVAFYTGRAAQDTVESAGAFRVFQMQAVDEPAAARCVETLELGRQSGHNDVRALRRAFRDWLVETIPGQITDLQPIVEEFAPDVIACDMSMWGPQLVLSGTSTVPVAISSTFLGPLIPGSDAPPAGMGFPPPHGRSTRLAYSGVLRLTDLVATGLRRRVDEIRTSYGLGALGCSVNEFTGQLPLYLVPSVRELDYGRTDLPASVHYVGPCSWQPARNPQTSAWLSDIPTERPWVHVTESTLRAGDPFLLKAAVAGLAGQPYEVIATTGQHRDPDKLGLGPLASNIHLTQWVNHEELLPRCSAVVTTGGAATVTATLVAGAPMVVVPTTWDKPDNARRVVEAGAGIRLSPRKCTPEGLREGVQRVLADTTFRQHARDMGAKLIAAPGPTGAAELLERLVTGPQHTEKVVPVARRNALRPRMGSQR